MSPEEELAHLREGIRRLARDYQEVIDFVDWLVPPLIASDLDHLTRQALSVKDRPQFDVKSRYLSLPRLPRSKDEK